MSDWTVRPVVPDDHARIVDVLNLTSVHPTTVAEFRHNDARRDTSHPFIRLTAQAPGGALAGYGLIGTGAWELPGHFFLRIAIAPAMSGRGAGGALYTALEAQGRTWGATRLSAGVRDDEPAARAFMERRGYVVAHHFYESNLDLITFDPAPFRPAVDAARAKGYELLSMRDLPGEEAWRELYRLHLEAGRDAPSGDEGRDGPFEDYARHTFDVPDYDPAGVYVALKDGEWAGMSGLHFPPGKDRAWTFFSGVRRAHRGQGLVQALKILAVEYAMQKGYKTIGTGNHSQNPAMLAVNRKFGFVRQPGAFNMRKELAPAHS